MSLHTATLARPKRIDVSSASALRLTVSHGPDAGSHIVVSPSQPMRVHVGTSSICELRLTDPMVSRRHLAIERSGEAFRVLDLDSTNGTTLNGVPIVEAYLRAGDTLSFGDTRLSVQLDEVAAEPAWSTMRFRKVIGASDAMRRLYPLCERIAKANVPTLIEGERGTGKEVLAESLHEASGRAGAFLVMDCAGQPDAITRELYGEPEWPGLFERASGGTLFLDEIGDLPAELQRELARVLDRGEVRRAGETIAREVDVRLVASTRRDLDRLVQTGRFEEQLLMRLAVTRILLPPLRQRAGDVALLARHLTEELDAPPLDAEILATLEDYHWPGNVTELRSAVMRYIALGELDARETIPPAGEPTKEGDWLDQLVDSDQPFSLAKRKAIEEFERRYIEKLLEKNDGNVSRAAAASGIALRSFQRVKSKHRVPRSPDMED